MEDLENIDDEIPEEAFEEDKNVPLCPISKEPLFESVKAYEALGFPEYTMWKIKAKRKMKAQEWADILKAYKEDSKPPILDGFISKEGKKFSAGIKIVKTDEGFKDEFFFPEPSFSDLLCPISNEPVEIREKIYLFKGLDGPVFKNWTGREMTIRDYIKVIEADGEPIHLRGFKTKKKETFDARVIFKNKKIAFQKNK